MRTPKLSFLSGFVLWGTFAGCGMSAAQDESMYLTGTEEAAITLANGQKACTNPKKVLICHIPPGNPANAHEICVGEPAVEAHQRNHGDTIGPCVPVPPTVDAGGVPVPPPVDAGTAGGADSGLIP
ncbi:MAG TPA: hypothetical protein VKE22_09695 [Haliangiales bacterium]|nr:hypothetical protein [Haliangiales bacterium]